MRENEIDEQEQTSGKLWFLVIGLAVLFLIYGLFMFHTIGDKGQPGWNFGSVEDIPGKSIYSTSPQPAGNQEIPETQHVSSVPPQAMETTGGQPK